MNAEEFRHARIAQRFAELERSMEVLLAEFRRWERDDVPRDLTVAPFMVVYGLLSELAADLAVASHDPIGHTIMELSERMTSAVRTLHRAQNGRRR